MRSADAGEARRGEGTSGWPSRVAVTAGAADRDRASAVRANVSASCAVRPMPTPTSIVTPSSARARSSNGSSVKSLVKAASEPRVAMSTNEWSSVWLTMAWMRWASVVRNRCTVSRSSSREYRDSARRAPSRSRGTSTTTTASWAASSRWWPPSSTAFQTAIRMAASVGRMVITGTPARASRRLTESRQVSATEVSPIRQSRSWNAASAAGLAGSCRSRTPSEERPSSA